jgi:hypothetical protein
VESLGAFSLPLTLPLESCGQSITRETRSAVGAVSTSHRVTINASVAPPFAGTCSQPSAQVTGSTRAARIVPRRCGIPLAFVPLGCRWGGGCSGILALVNNQSSFGPSPWSGEGRKGITIIRIRRGGARGTAAVPLPILRHGQNRHDFWWGARSQAHKS